MPNPNNPILPIFRGAPAPVPVTGEEMQWLNELFKPEEDYYKIYSPPAATPPKGVFLMLKEPLQPYIRIVWPSGEHEDVPVGKRMVWEISRFGMLESDVERSIDYVWNFSKVYVRSTDPDMWAPKISLKAVS